MKKLSLIVLIALAAVQFAVPVSLIRNKERILREGEVYRFLTRPIDPADPFQGRYVRLGFLHDRIAWPEDEEPDLDYKARIYAIVETGDDGFARFTGWSLKPPKDGSYLETRYGGQYRTWNQASGKNEYQGLRIDIPFDRFYMDEAKAPRAETLARDATRSTNCWVEVRILDGKAVIEDVFAEGLSLRVLAAEKE